MLNRLQDRIDQLNEQVGRWTAWATLALVLVQALVVMLRYVFGVGFIWMQDSILYFHSALFMLGVGYCLLHDGHVRVDVILERLSEKGQALVNLFAGLGLILPMVLVIGWYSHTYVASSWAIMEGSREASGLPLTFLLKSMIYGYCVLLGLQGISLAIRSALKIRAA